METDPSQTIVVRLTSFGDQYIRITARRQGQSEDIFQQIVHEADGFHLDLHRFVRIYPSLFMREPGGRIVFKDLIIEDERS